MAGPPPPATSNLSLVLLITTMLSLTAKTERFQCDLPHTYMLGDIAIPDAVSSEPMYADDYSKILTEEEEVEHQHVRRTRAAVRDRSRIWPDNTIPYIIAEEFNDYYVAMIRRAMHTWEENTCIRFIERTTEKSYLKIRHGRRCCSYVGRVNEGAQQMALEAGCMQHGILLHEFGHVIGFWHEQARPDRDDYIKVLPNFPESVRYNFVKRNESEVHDYGVEYDYGSIMHYGRTFFSIDGKSTTLLPLKHGVTIGQRLALSELDVEQANLLYMCQEDCSWTYNASEAAGSFQSMNYPNNYPMKTNCITKIHSKPSHVIRVYFETIDIEHHANCDYDYLEIRDGNLPTSPLLGSPFCGNLDPQNFTSTGPAIWVKFHSDQSVQKRGFFAHFVAFDAKTSVVAQVDPCSLKICEQGCHVIESDRAVCTCPSGYLLNEDGSSCRDENECMHDNNNGGCSHICKNYAGGYRCMCPRGYTLGQNGLTCDDLDECQSGRNRCSQLCVNTPGSSYCTCNEGYEIGPDWTSCVDLDECSIGNGACDQECFNSVGGHTCGCWTGYYLSSDQRSCSDVDECRINNGGCEQGCHNVVGSHICSCRLGYYLDLDGVTCRDVDECRDGTRGGCDHVCHNTIGSRYCSCSDGYTLANDTYCEDVDECEEVQCIGGECSNQPGTYQCVCHPDHILHPDDSHFCILGLQPDQENLTEEDTPLSTSLRGPRQRYTDPVCGPSEYSSPTLLTSPHYPSSYPTDTECSWIFSGKPGEQVHLTMLQFDLEPALYCTYDSFRVYDGSSDRDTYLANLCGRIRSRIELASTGPSLRVDFNSDMMTTEAGFRAAVDFTVPNQCGGRFVSERTSRPITWRSHAPQCMWTITGSSGNSIMLNFIRFRLSSSGACSVNEALEIYSTERRTLLARFCRNNPPPKLYIVPSSQITIVARALSEWSFTEMLLLHSSTSIKYTH